MSDKMNIIPFNQLINWIFAEYSNNHEIFGISKNHFYNNKNKNSLSLLNEKIETPLGPAAGPHTQLTQNLVAAYLTGGRFFELKTVQILDELEIDKPCIDARDEGYNIEWSQELKLNQSYEEYVKAWFLLHLLKEIFQLSHNDDPNFIFNMSVGYDLKGIQTEPMDNFINNLKYASANEVFNTCKITLLEALESENILEILKENLNLVNTQIEKIKSVINNISPEISGSMTLSTMHGCPPHEIEAISKYLIKEKGLHTYVKLNPTLLGFDTVKEILAAQGFKYIEMDKSSFDHDLQYKDAVPMLKRLQKFANENNCQFGVKLSNTLGVNNPGKPMTGEQMYMSGRALFPLTINLAAKLAEEFDGKLKISYSGGANYFNIEKLLKTGIYPITLATDLLKPGGYSRLFQLAKKTEPLMDELNQQTSLDVSLLKELSVDALTNELYHKSKHDVKTLKTEKKLGKFDCYISPCQEACPIHQDIPEYIRLIEEEKPVEAFETIISKNPLPHITGYICDHQCMTKCVRWDYDTPVHIRDIKKEAAETGYTEYLKQFKKEYNHKKNGIRAAIVGAGPAGLSAAYFLTKAGFEVTVFEKEELAGGTVQNVIPDFRLTREAIDKDIEFIKEHGVRFKYGIDEKFSVEELKKSGYKYIFIGIGAMKSSKINIEGDDSKIWNAVEFLRRFKNNPGINLGKNIAVIGGGNSAMDGARAALRCKGAEKVYIIYRRTIEYMPADKEELDAALSENVDFKELLLPVEFKNGFLKCQKMELGEKDTDGRRKVSPIQGEYMELEIDTIISAIGEKVDTKLLMNNNLMKDDISKLEINFDTKESIIENVYIGGDALRGPATVVEAIADGKKAAESICEKEKISEPAVIDTYKSIDIKEWQNELRLRKPLQIEDTKLTGTQEAQRCLGCKYLCNKCVDVCPNRANIAIAIEEGFNNSYQILHIDEMCNECGNCETFCPNTGAPYKEKTTLFWSEDEFNNSNNDGFLLKSREKTGATNYNYKIRFDGKVGFLTYAPKEGNIFSSLENGNIEFAKFKKMLINVLEKYNYLIK